MTAIGEFTREYWAQILGVATAVGFVWTQMLAWMEKQRTLRTQADKLKRANRIEDEDRKWSLADRYKQQADNLLKELTTLQQQLIDEKRKQIDTYKNPEEILVEIVTRTPHYLMWAKKRLGPKNYVMVAVNKPYAVLYLGGPPEIYIGKRDNEVWPEYVSKIFARSDENVHASQTFICVNEPVDSMTGIKGLFHGYKYPVRLGTNDYVLCIGIHQNASDIEPPPSIPVLEIKSNKVESDDD